MNGKLKILLALVASFILISSAQSLRAQDSEGALTASKLWVDKKTGQVFIRPGRNRVPLNIGNRGGYRRDLESGRAEGPGEDQRPGSRRGRRKPKRNNARTMPRRKRKSPR